MSPRALITGATGFIGSHLCSDLTSLGWKLTLWARPESRREALNHLKAEWIIGRTDDQKLLQQAVAGQEFVFHLAARIRSAPRKVYEEANHQFTRRLLEACIKSKSGLQRFLYVSSIAAAGPSQPGKILTEADPCHPESEYGRTKRAGEIAVQEYADALQTTIIRPPNVYGPRQQETEMLVQLIRRRVVPQLKARGKTTSLIYVDDLNRGIIESALSPGTIGKTYYLTDGVEYSWQDIISCMQQMILGKKIFLPVPEGMIAAVARFTDGLKKTGLVKSHFGSRAWAAMVKTHWLFSSEKASRDFGFRCEYSLTKGLQTIVGGS